MTTTHLIQWRRSIDGAKLTQRVQLTDDGVVLLPDERLSVAEGAAPVVLQIHRPVNVSSEQQQPQPRRDPVWPQILQGDPATEICEACPQFTVRGKDGCPGCRRIGGCAAGRKYKSAVMARNCPENKLQHLPPHALHSNSQQGG